jgi:xylulokinase
MQEYMLAHDLGTSGNKATLFRTDGQMVRSVTSPYEARFFHGNWAEQNPEEWWKAVCSSTQAMGPELKGGRLAAICFSGQMMGCLCVDREGRPLRPSILCCDQRSVAECDALLARAPSRCCTRKTG